MCCTRSVQVCCRTTAARWHASRRERQRVIPVPNGNLDKAISTESVLPRTIAKQRNGSKRLPTRAILEHRVLSASCTSAAGVFQGIYIRAYTWASIAAGLSGNQNEELKEMAFVTT